MNKYDLHTHTHYSDGEHSPSKLIAMASKIKLKGISITDHDSISGIFEAEKEAKKRNIEVIPGVEVQGMESEILGYFFNKEDNMLNMLLEKHRMQRKKYIMKKIEGLCEYGLEISYKEVLEKAGVGQNPNTFNIAQVMVEKKYSKDIEEAFKEYIRNISVRLSVPPTSTRKIIKIINDAGGKAILPHPWYLKDFQKSEIESFVIKLVSEGLFGIETSGYIPEDLIKFKNKEFMTEIKELCKKYELIETGGSDFHGNKSHENNILGKYTTPEKIINILRK